MKYVKFRTDRGCAVSGIRHIEINDKYPSPDLYNVVVYCEMGYNIYIEGESRHSFLKLFYECSFIDITEMCDITVTKCG